MVSAVSPADHPPAGITRAILGLMSAAREPLSADQLHAFLGNLAIRAKPRPGKASLDLKIGTCGAGDLHLHLDAVLARAEGFFDPAPRPVRERADAYRFFHTRVPEFIHHKLALDLRACHRALALACGRWKAWEADHPARDYALCFRLGHALDARDWPLAAQDRGRRRLHRRACEAVRFRRHLHRRPGRGPAGGDISQVGSGLRRVGAVPRPPHRAVAARPALVWDGAPQRVRAAGAGSAEGRPRGVGSPLGFPPAEGVRAAGVDRCRAYRRGPRRGVRA